MRRVRSMLAVMATVFFVSGVVETGRYKWKFGQWTRERELGTLAVNPVEGKLNPSLELRDDLSENVLSKLHR